MHQQNKSGRKVHTHILITRVLSQVTPVHRLLRPPEQGGDLGQFQPLNPASSADAFQLTTEFGRDIITSPCVSNNIREELPVDFISSLSAQAGAQRRATTNAIECSCILLGPRFRGIGTI